MSSRAQDWRAPVSLLGRALAALIALAVVNAQVQPPGGGCFGEPDWARWAFYGLAPLSVLAASAGAVAFALTLPLRLSMLLRAGFAFSIAVFWLVLLVLTLVAVEGPC